MRICLINPPNITHSRGGGSVVYEVFEPIGLGYIASVLEKNGHEVSILDALALGWKKYSKIDGATLVGLSYDEIAHQISAVEPDVVGISALFDSEVKSALFTAAAVKKVNPNIISVLGGLPATANPLEYLRRPEIDIVVRGEGELIMLNVVKTLQSEGYQKLDKVSGIGFKKDGVPTLTEPETFIQDLDSLPFPARHLLPLEKYYEAAKAGRSATAPLSFSKRWAYLVTSRGCPYQCVFCGIHLHMGRKWRARSPENVIAELEELVSKYRVNFIFVNDDNVTLDAARMERICDLILERGLKFGWDLSNGVRADSLNENLLKKMKAAGCKRIFVSPESGSQYVVDHIIKKRQSLAKVEEVVQTCKRIGLRVDCYFVLGLIGETKQNMRESIDFARKLKRLGATGFCFTPVKPLYGTELYRQAEALGCLTLERDEIYGSYARIQTPEFSFEEVKRFQREGEHLNPLFPEGYMGLALKYLIKDRRIAWGLALAWLRRLRG